MWQKRQCLKRLEFGTIPVAHEKAFPYRGASWPQEQGYLPGAQLKTSLGKNALFAGCSASPVLRLHGPGQAIETTQGLEATRPDQDHACRPVGAGRLELGRQIKKDTGNPHRQQRVLQHQPWEMPFHLGLVSLWKEGGNGMLF